MMCGASAMAGDYRWAKSHRDRNLGGYGVLMGERITEYRNGDYVFDVIDAGPVDGTPIVLLHGFPSVPPPGIW